MFRRVLMQLNIIGWHTGMGMQQKSVGMKIRNIIDVEIPVIETRGSISEFLELPRTSPFGSCNRQFNRQQNSFAWFWNAMKINIEETFEIIWNPWNKTTVIFFCCCPNRLKTIGDTVRSKNISIIPNHAAWVFVWIEITRKPCLWLINLKGMPETMS